MQDFAKRIARIKPEMLKVLMFCLVCAVCIVLFHFANGTTLLSKPDSFLIPGLKTQQTQIPYVFRPIYPNTIWLMTAGLTSHVQLSYVILQSCGLFFFLCAMARLATFIGGKSSAVFCVLLSSLSYPILFAWFEPVYSHDDLFQYGFCALALLQWLRKRFFSMSMLFSIATLFREATLFMFPGLVIAQLVLSSTEFWSKNFAQSNVFRLCVWLLIPVMLHLGFRAFYNFGEYHGRYEHWMFNLASIRMTDTLFSTLVAFLPGILMQSSNDFRFAEREKLTELSLLQISGIVMLPIFVFIVLFATKARETRIFFPPMIPLLPVAAVVIQERLKSWQRNQFCGLIIGLILVALVLAKAFPPFDFRPRGSWHWAYLIFNVTFFFVLWGREKILIVTSREKLKN